MFGRMNFFLGASCPFTGTLEHFLGGLIEAVEIALGSEEATIALVFHQLKDVDTSLGIGNFDLLFAFSNAGKYLPLFQISLPSEYHVFACAYNDFQRTTDNVT